MQPAHLYRRDYYSAEAIPIAILRAVKSGPRRVHRALQYAPAITPSVCLSAALSARLIPCRRFDIHVRSHCATFAGRAGDYEIFYYTAVTRSSHNREWHRRLSTYIRETLPGMVSNGHFTRPISACFHAF